MAAKLIGPNLDLQFFKKIHFLDEVIVFYHLPCKGLKATNERQDDGVGILHQVAQFPINQVYLIYKVPMPL